MAKRRSMPGNMGNMGGVMKQVQKMQKEMEKSQKALEDMTYEATVGGGAIKATVNGKYELLTMEIDEDVVDPDDVEMLQDLIITSVNTAIENARKDSEKTMGKLTGGMNIPGLM